MSICYELQPLDTLFFGGNIPMEAGLPAADTLFPPPVSVLAGAIRTAVLKEHDVSIADYKNGTVKDVIEKIGAYGEAPAFSITAFLVKKNNTYYVPAPASWYVESEKKPHKAEDFTGKRLLIAESKENTFSKLHIKSSEGSVPYTTAQKGNDAFPLSNVWLSCEFVFKSNSATFDGNDILLQKDIYSLENRTGNALDEGRRVKEGMLYSAVHLRLREDVTLCICLDTDVGLGEKGIMQLGGECRICRYEKIKNNLLQSGKQDGTLFVSLMPVAEKPEVLEQLVSSQKTIVTAGWDLAKGFHKPTENWLPAGAVFTKQVTNSCVALAHKN